MNKVLEKLNKANVGLNIEKCQFMKEQIKWLGFELTQTGIRPLESKVESIMNMKEPKTLKQLRGLMGSAHQLIKFIPNLATMCALFRPMLKSTSKYKWGPDQDKAFEKLKQAIEEVTQNAHFNVNSKTRVTRKSGLGAVLEQQQVGQWVPIAYASRFLNTAEKNTAYMN